MASELLYFHSCPLWSVLNKVARRNQLEHPQSHPSTARSSSDYFPPHSESRVLQWPSPTWGPVTSKLISCCSPLDLPLQHTGLCCSSNTPGTFPAQGLCMRCCLCLKDSSWKIPTGLPSSLPQVLTKGHLFSEAFAGFPIINCNPTPTFLSPVPCFFLPPT